MPRLGPLEIGLILVIILVLFGVGKLPQIGGAVGRSISEFRKASRSDSDENKAAKAEATVEPVKK